MKLFILLTTLLFYFTSSSAQSDIAPNFNQENYPQFSINISVLGKNMTSADNYFDEAERFEKVGDYKGAISNFNKAATSYLLAKKYVRYGTTLVRLSNAQLSNNNSTEAEQTILKLALKVFSRIGNKSGQMFSYQTLGRIYSSNNKLTQSLWFYTQQGILAIELHDKTSHIESILGIVSVKIKKKDFDLALKDLNQAELLCKNANMQQYDQQIKRNKSIIAEKIQLQKG